MRKSKKSSYCKKVSIISVLIMGLFLISVSSPTAAEDGDKEHLLVDKALITFKYFLYHPEMGYFKDHLKDIKGLLIVPSMIRAGLILGGEGGQGVLLVRDEKTDEWSGPGFYTIGAGSLGLQIGAQVSQVIFLIKSQKVVESLYASSFKLGGDISVAAGPVGTGAAAKGLNADIVSYSRSKGVFAGMAFDGAVIATRDSANDSYYGETVRPIDIFVSHKVSNPQAKKLLETVAEAVKQF